MSGAAGPTVGSDVGPVTGAQLWAALEQAVGKVGQRHRYPDDLPGAITSGGTCRYRHPETGEPLCLYGRAFAELGLLERLSANDVSSIRELLVDEFGLYASDPWIPVFQYGQDTQDSLAYWSTALKGMRQMAVARGLLDG